MPALLVTLGTRSISRGRGIANAEAVNRERGINIRINSHVDVTVVAVSVRQIPIIVKDIDFDSLNKPRVLDGHTSCQS